MDSPERSKSPGGGGGLSIGGPGGLSLGGLGARAGPGMSSMRSMDRADSAGRLEVAQTQVSQARGEVVQEKLAKAAEKRKQNLRAMSKHGGGSSFTFKANPADLADVMQVITIKSII